MIRWGIVAGYVSALAVVALVAMEMAAEVAAVDFASVQAVCGLCGRSRMLTPSLVLLSLGLGGAGALLLCRRYTTTSTL